MEPKKDLIAEHQIFFFNLFHGNVIWHKRFFLNLKTKSFWFVCYSYIIRRSSQHEILRIFLDHFPTAVWPSTVFTKWKYNGILLTNPHSTLVTSCVKTVMSFLGRSHVPFCKRQFDPSHSRNICLTVMFRKSKDRCRSGVVDPF